MSIGASGRVVIEMDPTLKKALYSALRQNGLTLKDWFVQSAENYLTNTTQLALNFEERQARETEDETTK
ncbi:hypothetical protein C8R30_1238 [Nitrosomonas nitrosa]|jgi:hypothetical protein|uniref:Toxin-antitoxin system HicB family antitoxin n=1 Tax=Nitrosomonas nitrosa TaxID=52442 RepID=A0A8H8Z2X4_9PROT|nr:hypothetical protein [Nitrosomonas nitrosa]MCO6433071.1 hypothetical protein [Nitrosomonas nitrosa]PTQ92475.1 hypothetical protein C8R30_1238 [Nitrosomonas nitrosa]CAE6516719.1 conserved hypothetical protein [Nitrosomonas nitrosa]